jgi:hypothetical protein
VHLRFHLLKQGITEESVLVLILAKLLPQALWDAVNAKMKNGKAVLEIQVELETILMI